jgi:DNA mismatch repair protein MutS2
MTLKYWELSNLEYEGGNQPNLEAIVKFDRTFFTLLIEYQEFLSDIDVVAAKAKYQSY